MSEYKIRVADMAENGPSPVFLMVQLEEGNLFSAFWNSFYKFLTPFCKCGTNQISAI